MGGQFGRLLDAPEQSRKAHSNDILENVPCLVAQSGGRPVTRQDCEKDGISAIARNKIA